MLRRNTFYGKKTVLHYLYKMFVGYLRKTMLSKEDCTTLIPYKKNTYNKKFAFVCTNIK